MFVEHQFNLNLTINNQCQRSKVLGRLPVQYVTTYKAKGVLYVATYKANESIIQGDLHIIPRK